MAPPLFRAQIWIYSGASNSLDKICRLKMAAWGLVKKKYPVPPARFWNVSICISGVPSNLYQHLLVQSSIRHQIQVRYLNLYRYQSIRPLLTKAQRGFLLGVGDGGGEVRYRTLFPYKISLRFWWNSSSRTFTALEMWFKSVTIKLQRFLNLRYCSMGGET